MADVNRVITLGIGPASDISGFILSGLNVSQAVVFTGILGVTARRRIEALDVQARAGIYAVDTFIGWPDGYYVGFGDDTGIGWADLSGDNAGKVPYRIETLKVNRT